MVTVPSSEESRAALELEVQEGRALGFTGKQCIHPLQVDLVQRALEPSDESLKWALRVRNGDAIAITEGKGAWKLDGKMVDAPIVKRALAMLERAQLGGIDVAQFGENL